jgi:hypothetical protein
MSFVVLYIYKWVSSPKAIKATKDQIKAHILAIRIYKDLWKVIVSSFFKSLYYTFKYFVLNFGPVLLILPVLFPAFVQMDIRYGMQPFKVGDELAVKAKLNPGLDGKEISLVEDGHYKAAMKPVFIKALDEVNWKLEVLKPGASAIKIKVGDTVYEKRLLIGESLAAVSNRKLKQSRADHFIYPAEKLLPEKGEVEHIYISYPGREITFAGITMHWLVLNLILVVIVVLALKNRFGVEF